MKLIVATQNSHKLAEIRDMFVLPGLTVVGSDVLDEPIDVVEDGDTFEANALLKARAYARITGEWSISDDSGICTAALDGAPGIRSARFAGETATDEENNARLLELMADQDDRRAWFYCALALVAPDGREWVVSGRCDGELIQGERGPGGFGYDPMFIPDGSERTFGEMSQEEKNQQSHRSRALSAAVEQWAHLLGGE